MRKIPKNNPPYVLAIGGFDPSGGAGVIADAQTINAFGAHGLAVITANTVQHEDLYQATHWVDPEVVYQQLEILLARYPIAALKVGMVPSAALLAQLLVLVRQANPSVMIVVDPVLRSTASYAPLREETADGFDALYANITLLTPNAQEFSTLYGDEPAAIVSKRLGCALLLKGGHAHASQDRVVDRLYKNGIEHQFDAPRLACDKHGTGCVLGAAIAASLAWGADLLQACAAGQRYVGQYLTSNPTRLGLHAPADCWAAAAERAL